MLHGIYVHDFLLAGGYLLSVITCGCVTMLVIYIRYIQKNLNIEKHSLRTYMDSIMRDKK